MDGGIGNWTNGKMFGAGVGGILGGIFNTSDYQNPADAGMPYFNQAENMLPHYYQPFINAGLQALPQLQSQYGQLVSNPGQKLNQIGSQFQSSPGYGFQVNQALGAANRAAAAGGMAGTPMEQQNIATTVNGLANQDYYNYLNHAMSMYGMGMQGLGNLYQTGYGASNELASNLANILQSQAEMAYAGQANQNQNTGGSSGSIIGGAADIGSILGGM